VKDLVVKKLREMKADGSLSEVLQGGDSDSPDGRRKKRAA
jgi:hypothetical protein